MSGSAHVAHLRLVPTRAFLNRQTTSRFHNGRKLAVGQTSDGLCRMYADPNRIHALSFVPSRLSARCAGGRIAISDLGIEDAAHRGITTREVGATAART